MSVSFGVQYTVYQYTSTIIPLPRILFCFTESASDAQVLLSIDLNNAYPEAVLPIITPRWSKATGNKASCPGMQHTSSSRAQTHNLPLP